MAEPNAAAPQEPAPNEQQNNAPPQGQDQAQAMIAQLLQIIAAQTQNVNALQQMAQNPQPGPKHGMPKLDRFSKGDPQPWKVQIQNQFRACHVPEGDQYAHAVAALEDPAASLWNSREQQNPEGERTLEGLFTFLDSSGQLTREHEAFGKLDELQLDPRKLEDSTAEFNRLAERAGAVYTPEGLSALFQLKVQHMSSPLCNEVMQQNGYKRYGDVLELQKLTAAVFQAQSHLLDSAVQKKDTWVQRATKASRKPAARPAQQQVAKKQKHTAAAAPAGKGVVISGQTFYPSGVKRTEEEKTILASDGRCFWCIQKGHQARDCPDKGKLKGKQPKS